tara:strand:- start:574 stop:915 length:342 start_codon:yes stop_codon:yes gene_type:complete
MKAYSQDLRDRVVLRYNTGKYKITELAKLFNICRQTISAWVLRYKETGDYSSKQHIQTGRKPRFTEKEKVLEFLLTNPDSEGVGIRDRVMVGLPMSTVYDTLRRMKITYKKRA